MSSADQLPQWPPTTVGWSRVEYPPIAGQKWTHGRPQRAIEPTDFRNFTPAGLEQLARILREGIRRAKAGAA